MIVCVVCDDVLYFGTMPKSCADLERVVCPVCEMVGIDYYENMAYDLANDR